MKDESTSTSTPTSDKVYVLLARNGFRCAICFQKDADATYLLVPLSYGGTEVASNLAPAHACCARLRHDIEGSDPEPPAEHKDNLTRMLNMSVMRQTVLSLFYCAATQRLQKKHRYQYVRAEATVKDLISNLVGWGFRGRTDLPEGITRADEEWLKSSSAWRVVTESAYALLPADSPRV